MPSHMHDNFHSKDALLRKKKRIQGKSSHGGRFKLDNKFLLLFAQALDEEISRDNFTLFLSAEASHPFEGRNRKANSIVILAMTRLIFLSLTRH